MKLLWILLKFWWGFDYGFYEQVSRAVLDVDFLYEKENHRFKFARAQKTILQARGESEEYNDLNLMIEFAIKRLHG